MIEEEVVYKEYEAALLKANAMDFDDLIMQCVLLLQKNFVKYNILKINITRYNPIIPTIIK